MPLLSSIRYSDFTTNARTATSARHTFLPPPSILTSNRCPVEGTCVFIVLVLPFAVTVTS